MKLKADFVGQDVAPLPRLEMKYYSANLQKNDYKAY